MDIVRAATSNIYVVATMAADASGELPIIPTTNMFSTPIMFNIMEAMNAVYDVCNNDAPIDLPLLTYYLRPILDFEATNLIGKAATDILNEFKEYNLQQITNKIPVHGYVVVEYPLGTGLRRQVVLNVGPSISETVKAVTNDASRLFSLFNSSFVEYADRVQSSEDGENWVTEVTIYQTKGFDIDAVNTDLSVSTPVESYNCRLSINYIRSFLDCMYVYEEKFDFLSHNCQTMSRELINYAIVGSLPHWWNSTCSVLALKQEFSNFYGLQLPSQYGVMPHIFMQQTVYLNNNAPNPNMLDYYRGDYMASFGNWTGILSGLIG